MITLKLINGDNIAARHINTETTLKSEDTDALDYNTDVSNITNVVVLNSEIVNSDNSTNINQEVCYIEIEMSTIVNAATEIDVNTTDYENNVWYTDYAIEAYSDDEFVPKKVSDFILDEGYIGGTIPLLNRKVHRGTRASVYEFPFVVSIRRNLAHYQIAVILTPNVVLTVAHGVYNVPIYDLTLVQGENYSDRGTDLVPIVLMILHQDFNPYTLEANLAILRTNSDMTFKGNVKEIMILRQDILILETEGTLVGWGRCDHTGKELCLPRSTKFFPNEIVDPMLRSVKIQIDKTPYCDVYTKVMNLTLYPGMLCTGPSRLEQPAAPCMGVPGAPLIIYSYLVGLQSWGYGCGYKQDLPVVYTDIRFYTSWLEHELSILLNITSKDLDWLFTGSQSYVISRMLRSLRDMEPLQINKSENLEMLELDKRISELQGTVYDYRDYIFDGSYFQQKQNAYKEWRREKLNKLILQSIIPNTTKCEPFLRMEDRHYLYEYGDDKSTEY